MEKIKLIFDRYVTFLSQEDGVTLAEMEPGRMRVSVRMLACISPSPFFHSLPSLFKRVLEGISLMGL